jgi:uncharacterized membrane protein YkoI
MKYGMLRIVLVSVTLVGVTGCCCGGKKGAKAEKKEAPGQTVSLAQVAEPARVKIQELTTGGQIKSIEKEEKDGKTLYDVEATVQGRDVEYDIAADGTVLSSEQSVPYASLPLAVRSAAEKYFGSAAGLKVSVELEGGKNFYEVEGKNGKALKLSAAGEILEKEKK